MAGPIPQEAINRSYSDQVRQLTAEVAKLQGIINQRSVNVAVECVEGLGLLVQQAQAGDAASRQVVVLLRERLKSLDAIVAGLVVVKS
jgi:hypothetical protein